MQPIKQTLISMTTLVVLCGSVAQAHFPWLVRNSEGKLEYYFGENIADRLYRTPDSIAAARVFCLTDDGQLQPVATVAVKTDTLDGLTSTEPIAENQTLISEVTYGIHRGGLLKYTSLSLGDSLPSDRKAYAGIYQESELHAELVDNGSQLVVHVSRSDQPLADIAVRLLDEQGEERGQATTDKDGKAEFAVSQIQPGLNGLMLGHTFNASGKVDDVAYETCSHYFTATFNRPASRAKQSQEAQPASLPFGITSFGAARHGDALYVYGGHTGSAHSYWDESQSNQLFKLDITDSNGQWKEVATGQRLQGLAMVAHDDRVILIGGFSAKNAKGEPHDLYSQDAVVAWDVASDKWDPLPSLPEPRSSHDAAVIDDTLYVVGGWKLAGADVTQWHSTAWSLNLSIENSQWQELTPPPFSRRALATIAHQGKLFVVGGMNEKGGPTKAVAIYDPRSKSWSEAKDILGQQDMAGFGAAGWSHAGQLVVTSYEGDIQLWDASLAAWQLVGQTRDARFFHRLLPWDDRNLIALGGASMEIGKFLEPEIVPLP